MELRPDRVHSTFLFPTVVLLFVLQPVLASLLSAASELLTPPLGLTLLVGIWSLDPGPRVKRFGIAVFVALLATVAMQAVAPGRGGLLIGILFLDLLALAAVALGIRWLFRLREITAQTLLASMSIFLLIGILFATLCLGLYQLDSGAFAGLSEGGRSAEAAELVYYSIATLTGTTYGDIVPVHPIARLLSNAEAVAGQMYMAVLVALLVSNYAAARGAGGGGGSAPSAGAPPVERAAR